MRPTDIAKRRKYPVYLAFYDFTAIQGKRLGWLTKILGGSNITHVAPIFVTPTMGEISITICAARREDGQYHPVSKLHSPSTLVALGAVEIDRIYFGEIEMNLENVIQDARSYTDVKPWDLVFHSFIGRFIGLTRPRACSSFACKLVGIKDVFHPATIWRLFR